MALSTIELEYMAATHESKGIVWLKRLFLEIGFKQQVVRLDYDS